jgi:hypothetical protein
MTTHEEKIALKVACLRAAATLLADPNKCTINPLECATTAKRIYDHVVKIDWDTPGL